MCGDLCCDLAGAVAVVRALDQDHTIMNFVTYVMCSLYCPSSFAIEIEREKYLLPVKVHRRAAVYDVPRPIISIIFAPCSLMT